MSKGRYGEYGGQYISETLMNELLYLEEQYNHYMNDPEFVNELNTLLSEYALSKASYQAIKLKEDDSIANVTFCNEEDFIIISKQGMAIRFESKLVNSVGRIAAGNPEKCPANPENL